MNRTQRLLKKAAAERLRQERADNARQARDRQERDAQAVAKAIKKPPKQPYEIKSHVFEHGRAARLLTAEYSSHLSNVYKFQTAWVRNLDSWEPSGKARSAVFRSLLEHLFSRFKTPKFLWSVFEDAHLGHMSIVVHLAGGGSLYEKVLSKEFPVPFTRKMCHEFLQTTSEYSFLAAIRRTQVKAYGGTQQLFRAWMATVFGRTLYSAPEEEFWGTVLQFFAKNPMMEMSQIGPLNDYIEYRRRRDKSFSMKGRTVMALLRDMTEWHGDLAKQRAIKGETFIPSGFKEGIYETKDADGRIVWTVQEILSSKGLIEEGRALRHCVASYSYKVEKKYTSIWSLRANGDRALTLEVDNQNRLVVQYRGKFNALPKTPEYRIVLRWAQDNGLRLMNQSTLW